MILGALGILRGKRATIYPGMESHLTDALPGTDAVVTDGNITTSRAPGTAIPFSLRLAELLTGDSAALTADIVFQKA